jgi:hypothetical protein
MSEGPLTPGEFDDVDALYRRASARDTGGPSESVRRAVLEHAARLAAERAAAERTGVDLEATEHARGNVVDIRAAKRRAMRPTWWRPAAFGTLAAASLAGLLIAPQFMTPRAPPQAETKPVSAPASVTQPPPAEAAPPVPQQAKSAYSGAPAANTNTDLAADRLANTAPAPERNLAKTQTALTAPRRPAAQDELKEELEQTTVTAQRKADGQEGAADSAGVPVEARRARSQAASGAVASAPAAAPALQSTTPMAAARLVDPAAELRHAAGLGDIAALQAALERRPVIDARDANGRTALMLAVMHGRAEAVDVLLAAGADPNAADARSVTPLQAALDGEQADIAVALRRAGAK